MPISQNPAHKSENVEIALENGLHYECHGQKGENEVATVGIFLQEPMSEKLQSLICTRKVSLS